MSGCRPSYLKTVSQQVVSRIRTHSLRFLTPNTAILVGIIQIHTNFGCLKWLVKMVKSPKIFVSGLSAKKASELLKGFEILNAMSFRWQKHLISTSDFKSQKPVAKVIYLIMNLMFLTDFLISGKQVPAQTSEPGLHLESKAGRIVCRNGSRRHFHLTKKIVNWSQ